ncbi:MAG TPA: sec-independent translocase [Streptosporangiaceae bacterium]
MFDLSIPKILILGVLGLVIFGPDQLPRMAAQVGRALRDLRRLADRARADLTDSLGPEFSDFDFNDLNPKTFVRKHLLDDLDDESLRWSGAAEVPDDAAVAEPAPAIATLDHGELPPWDSEAT